LLEVDQVDDEVARLAPEQYDAAGAGGYPAGAVDVGERLRCALALALFALMMTLDDFEAAGDELLPRQVQFRADLVVGGLGRQVLERVDKDVAGTGKLDLEPVGERPRMIEHVHRQRPLPDDEPAAQ